MPNAIIWFKSNTRSEGKWYTIPENDLQTTNTEYFTIELGDYNHG